MFWKKTKNRKKNIDNRKLDLDLRFFDADQDKLSDYEELYLYGSDPYDPDSDHDAIDDGEEVNQGTDPSGNGNLKNLFIPHQGNDYRPQILSPKRLFFYGLTSVFMKLIVAFLAVSLPISAWLTPDVMTQESKKIISLTNDLRSRSGIGLLQESQLLNRAAYLKAQDMLVNQYFAHVSPQRKDVRHWLESVGYKYDIAGENLAIGFASSDDVVNAWIRSRTHYANLIDPDYNQIGVGMVSGPFNGYETTLVAQFFGLSTVIQPAQVEVKQPVVESTVADQPKLAPIIDQSPKETVANEQVQEQNKQQPQDVPVVQEPEKISDQPAVDTNNIKTNIKQPETQIAPKPVVPKQTISIPQPPVSQSQPTVVKQPETELQDLIEDQQVDPFVLTNLLVTRSNQDVPVIINPVNNIITNQKDFDLVIFAPQAEKILVYSDQATLGSKDKSSLMDGYFSLTIPLYEGRQQLYAVGHYQGRMATSSAVTIVLDTVSPEIDHEKSTIEVLGHQSGEMIVKAKIFSSVDVAMASVQFGDYNLTLQKSDNTEENNIWTGSVLLSAKEYQELFDPAVPPAVLLVDEAGNMSNISLGWEGIQPLRPSLIKQYVFATTYPTKQLDTLLDFTSIYYLIVLVVAIIALMLGIFVEIKKQRPKLIVSTLSFIGLLVLLIIV